MRKVSIICGTALTRVSQKEQATCSAFIGLNLLQSAFTGFCPPSWLFRKLGLPEAR